MHPMNKPPLTHSYKPPLVSVVMPVFQHTERKLRRAIQSILDQTYPHFELIIVDGAKTRQNESVVQSFADPRIRYFRQTGYINCLNYGLKQSKGTYIARMDSDDISYPTRLAEQVHFLQHNPQIDLCSCLADLHGDTLYKRSCHRLSMTLENIIQGEAPLHPAIMFRRKLNVRYDPLKPLEDCLLFRKLTLKHTKFAIINKPLYSYYIAPKSIMKMYPRFIDFLMLKIHIWTFAKYTHSSLPFADQIFVKKTFSRKDIVAFMKFSYAMRRHLKHLHFKIPKDLRPYWHYMWRHSSWSARSAVLCPWYFLSFFKWDMLYFYKRLFREHKKLSNTTF